MKYIPSIAFEEMSGSAKGVTAAKMKNRKYIRNRGYGGSIRTSDQAKVKSVFKMLTTKWKTLTNEQILAWNKLALSQAGRSVLGTSAKISGSNLFTRLNFWVVTLGGQVMETPPELNSVEAPSTATIVCQGETFTFKLDQAPADNGGIFLVIEASEGQSNGVSRAHSKATQIKLVEEPTAAAVDIRADYVAKNGAPGAAAPKIFFRYYLVDSSTGVKSQTMLAECKWIPGV
ncbi:MAG: hypothetical protein K5652_04795 [Bacteroidales bacterium]|jgi:hypothetical protein|nr:hypothetical protein [Bacteroidales bacterium]